MPEYLAPGVYMEEFEIGAKPIEGVSTSTAAFLGIAKKGPLDKPTLITNQQQFVIKFGSHLKKSYLAYAVEGFFRNGGKRCFIVRVAHDAKKAKIAVNSTNDNSLMLISALTEGKWGNDISIEVKESSSGSTILFLSKLTENVAAGVASIKFSSATGLSKGSKIVISDGTNTEGDTDANEIKVDLRENGIVSLSRPLGNSYNMDVSYAYVKLSTDSLHTTVKSATGFNVGGVVMFLVPDLDTKPDDYQNPTVILSAVKQPDKKLGWETPLGSDINGAVCMDIKGVKTEFDLLNSNITEGSNSVPKANLDPKDTSKSVDRLKQGDKIEFIESPKKEILTIHGTTGSAISFKETFKYNYTAGNSTSIAMTSSITDLFSGTYQQSGFIINAEDTTATITLDNGIKGLQTEDFLTLVDPDDPNNSTEVQIDEVIDDTHIKLTSEPGAAFQVDGTQVRFTLKATGTSIVVSSIEGFSPNNLIDIDGGAAKKGRFRISTIKDNRITFTRPDFPQDVNEATVTAKQWNSTSVRSQEFKIVAVYGDNEVEETFDKLSISESSGRYFGKEGIINKKSTLIEVEDVRDSPGTPPSGIDDLPSPGLKSRVEKGSDGGDIKASDYIGTVTSKEERTGLQALEAVDDVNILAIPDLMMSFGGGNGNLSPDAVEQVQLAMIGHCEKLKDRFAILDPIKGYTTEEIQEWRMDNLDSKYAALYYPWIKVSDPIEAEYSISRLIPPSGYIAGIYARSDTERGVHKAPANEIVRGVTDTERSITTGEQEALNPDGINCIRAFSGRGIRVWGARTISSDSLWKYINIRRLFIYVEESIEKNTQWVVFEPNDEKLWARVRATITQFLTGVWRDGALMGTKVEEAFFVKCDRTTMTQDDIDNGRLICVIGIAPVKPAEFVIFRIAQWQGGSSATE